MEYVIEKSLVIEYWNISLIILLFILLIFYLKSNKLKLIKSQKTEAFCKGKLNDSYTSMEHVPYKGIRETFDGGIEKFYRVLNDRRSIRSFSKKSVDYNIIKKCIQTAGTAPSGAHTEPWTFCVVENSVLKQKVREIVEQEEFKNYQYRMGSKWVADLEPFKVNHVKSYLTDASHLILVFKQIHGYEENGSKKQHYYNEISVSIAVGILISALQCAKLNSLVTTPLNCGPALRNLLNRPSNEKLLVLLPVGYASDDCIVPAIKRKQIDEILVKY